MILHFKNAKIGELIINLNSLIIKNFIDWIELWKLSNFEPSIFADNICGLFDFFYEKYGIEHNFEPDVYAEILGDFKVVLTTKNTEYILYINLNDTNYIVEQPTIFNELLLAKS